MRRMFGTTVLAVVVACGIQATAHHSNPLYFDLSKAITLEGTILRVEWINPHVLLFLQSKDEKGEVETWVLHGRSLNNALREVGAMKERLNRFPDLRSRLATAYPTSSERRADGLADETRRRQKTLAHRGSRADQVLQRRCAGLWRRTDVLKRVARTIMRARW